MHHTLRSFRIRRPRAVVWAYVSDLRNYEDWHPLTIAVHQLAGDGDVGTRYRRVSTIDGVRSEMDFIVVRCVAGVGVGFHGQGAGMELLDSVDLHSSAGEVEVVRRFACRWFDDDRILDVAGMEEAADMAIASLYDSVLQL